MSLEEADAKRLHSKYPTCTAQLKTIVHVFVVGITSMETLFAFTHTHTHQLCATSSPGKLYREKDLLGILYVHVHVPKAV